MAADVVPEGPCDRCRKRPADTPEGLCSRCVAELERWRRAQQARRRRTAAGEAVLPMELGLDRTQVNALATALRVVSTARDVLDVVAEAGKGDSSEYGPDAVEDALWDLAHAYDQALVLLRPVLPPGILPPGTTAP